MIGRLPQRRRSYAPGVARYLDVHPDSPQPRLITQAVELLRHDGVIAYPTECAYALGWRLGSAPALERVRELRRLDQRHHFTLACHDLSQASQFGHLGNWAFRAVKASIPGPFTFILPATRDVPKRLQHPKKSTVGVRIPADPVAQALVVELGEPLVTTSLLLPGEADPPISGWYIKERLDTRIEAVLDAGERGTEQTTVIDLTGSEPEIVRLGAGDPSRFE
jgi:tRNA threonylcarbamoyl adenosine modification protein (Sua5/YciO/YrdC/YwlC family)